MVGDQLNDAASALSRGAANPEIPISMLRGRLVVDHQDGMPIGEVNEVFVDHITGEPRYLRLSTGGILGIGKAYGLVPMEAVIGIQEERIHVDPLLLLGATTYIGGHQPRWDIPRKTSVLSADDREIGKVMEVHPGFVVAEHGIYFPEDFYIPNDAIAIYDGQYVRLTLTKDNVLKQRWDQAPPLLVRATHRSKVG